MTFRRALLVLFLVLPLCSNAQKRVFTIDEIFSLAEKNSKSIKVHDLAIDEAVHGVDIARNDLLPSLDVHAEFKYIGDGYMTDRDFTNGEHADMPHWGNTFVLKASQVIYAGGSIRKNIERSQLNERLAREEFENNRQNIRFMLLGYYLDIFQLSNQKLVYERNIRQTELLVKDMKISYNQGTALKSDITRYELQLQNLELGLTSVKNKISVLNHHLAVTIGLDPATSIVPDSAMIANITVKSRGLGEWMGASESSPLLKMARTKLELSKNNASSLKSELRPHIDFSITSELAGPILIEVPPMDNNFAYWFAGVGISYNLDALYKTKKKIKRAKIDILKNREEQMLVEEELENAIHSAYVALDEAYVRLDTKKKSVQLAHENFNIIRQRYINGLSLITDMLDASNTQLDMELQLANSQVDLIYQYYLLKKITGQL